METKWILISKRFWGLLTMLMAVMIPWMNTTFGTNIDMLAWTGLSDAVVSMIDTVAVAFGFLLTFWGSWTAQAPLSVKRMK